MVDAAQAEAGAATVAARRAAVQEGWTVVAVWVVAVGGVRVALVGRATAAPLEAMAVAAKKVAVVVAAVVVGGGEMAGRVASWAVATEGAVV